MMLPIAAMIAEGGGAAMAGGAAEGVVGAAGADAGLEAGASGAGAAASSGGGGGMGGMMKGLGGMMPKIGGGDKHTAANHVITYADAPSTGTDLFTSKVNQVAARADPTPQNFATMQAHDMSSGAFADAAKRQSVWQMATNIADKFVTKDAVASGETGTPLNEVKGQI